jgi:hypothetical protein
MKKILAVAGVCALAATGCSMDKYTEPYKDAPRSGTNDRPAEVITMPDGFSNVAAKCDGHDRVFVVYKGDANRAAIAVVPNSSACQ